MKIKIPVLKNSYHFTEEQKWKMIILLFIFFFLAVLAANVYFFLRVNEEIDKPLAPEAGLSNIALKRDIFEQILDDLQKKEHYFNQGLMSKPEVSDPSL